jgi:hypothetical protein
MHRCFFTSLPPNLGLSKQYKHCPQSSAKQPGHSRQPILLLLVTDTVSSPNCCFRLEEPEGVALITIPLVDGFEFEANCGESMAFESSKDISCLIDCLFEALLAISLFGCLLIFI